ncbi:MAG: glycosyltransferase [Clostridia bacterium]|nr:glycosyltransferase [Clostridia bacterium]
MPSVSILMGIYHCEKTLSAAVRSILAQTFGDWELILCDDGSTDDTYAAAKALSETDGRIVLLRNETNLGLPKTLNRCAAAAKGEYFARMDGDDVCDPTRLQKEFDVISRGEFAIVSCGMLFFDDGGVYGRKIHKEYPEKADFAASSPFCHAGAMFTREAFEAVGGYSEQPDRLRIEDYDLWYRMYRAGYKGYNLPEPLYSIRDDRTAVSRKKFRYRVNEYKLRRRIASEFGLGAKAKISACKPLLLGVLPLFAYQALHRARLKSR